MRADVFYPVEFTKRKRTQRAARVVLPCIKLGTPVASGVMPVLLTPLPAGHGLRVVGAFSKRSAQCWALVLTLPSGVQVPCYVPFSGGTLAQNVAYHIV
jgi:hypothetical protein